MSDLPKKACREVSKKADLVLDSGIQYGNYFSFFRLDKQPSDPAGP